MYTLGINAVFHDPAACILKDGVLLAAAEEERFTHKKHGKQEYPFATWELPFEAINYCLFTAGINLCDVDNIAYSFDPAILSSVYSNPSTLEVKALFDALNSRDFKKIANFSYILFLSSVMFAPLELVSNYPHHLQKRFKGTNVDDFKWHFVNHHDSHAASAFYPSPFDNAAVLVLDGGGELASTSYSVADLHSMVRIGEVNRPHSLGLLYTAVTEHLGFLRCSDEYKVMALASYGKPEFVKDFQDLIQLGANGKFTTSYNDLEKYFGASRNRNEKLTSRHFNIAHSLQLVLQETVLQLTNWLHRETRQENLCMAGGVALNCVLNAHVRDKSFFRNVWVQPAAGDSGTALGAAVWVDRKERKSIKKDFLMDHAYWGPNFSDHEIEIFLKWAKVPYRRLVNVAEETAEILAQDKIVGWFQGRMEYGPRALGARSILASPINPTMQARLNHVKDREDFRPVAPVVLEEDAAEWFEAAEHSPFMLFVCHVKPDKADRIPAVCHIDGTARIQTINSNQQKEYYDLLKAFKDKTGVPVLVNTSFNTLGRPIVCSPRDAIECFWTSSFDALVIGSFLVEKAANPNFNHINKDNVLHMPLDG